MNLKVGIIGLPNAGKSTLFNALLKKQVADVAPYPFCTIEPNIGVVPVPDARLEDLAKVVEATEGTKPPIVPAVVEFVDIAGLVKGASQGEGLGNKFLSHIREVHLIVNVLRFFEDPSVVHVAGEVDVLRDKEIIETELILADLQTINKQIEPKMNTTKEERAGWEVIRKLKEGLNAGNPASAIITDPDERKLLRELNLLTMKPVLYVANVSELQMTEQGNNNVTIEQLQPAITVCAKTEFELASLPENEQKEYLQELGLSVAALDRMIQKAYEMLGLISFLTARVKEVRAWTVERGVQALQAAGVIHTDFEKKFIKADVVDFSDFVSLMGWQKCREEGEVRSEGRGYQIQDGDVIEFKIGT
ncbi:redox-regulated ATPase YchF [Patescibacteria group bacterium]|nr:redox-regulated ATPase YchF [Patescibacteria group bacterium]MBU1472484.1 redox-regulated ATPase YchF [Patescibacteria group bacterium]MBU2460298.1 redox-regulated ATPase YchF [Patescibacteria group bacterium]MBU2543844.1 redox-regulated ATPase YchF [Patescibacteria group bacterium]